MLVAPFLLATIQGSSRYFRRGTCHWGLHALNRSQEGFDGRPEDAVWIHDFNLTPMTAAGEPA